MTAVVMGVEGDTRYGVIGVIGVIGVMRGGEGDGDDEGHHGVAWRCAITNYHATTHECDRGGCL